MSIIVISGPTGSGKSSLLREVAATLPGHAYWVDLLAEADARWSPPHDDVAVAMLDHVSQSLDGPALVCDAVRWASERTGRALLVAVQDRRDLHETELPKDAVEMVLGKRRVDPASLLRLAGFR